MVNTETEKAEIFLRKRSTQLPKNPTWSGPQDSSASFVLKHFIHIPTSKRYYCYKCKYVERKMLYFSNKKKKNRNICNGMLHNYVG